MDDQEVRSTARIRYRLTTQGHRKLETVFINVEGQRRKFGSVLELDARTVARIYYNRDPFDLASLMTLFSVLQLQLNRSDYERAPRFRANTSDSAPSGTEGRIIEPESDYEFTGNPDGGAELLFSPFYIEREADRLLKAAIRRQDSTILLKGSRHCGKSSLLARGLQEARTTGYQTVCTDFDNLDRERLRSKDSLYRAFAGSLAFQCDSEDPGEMWKSDMMPNEKLEYYLRRFFKQRKQTLIWAMDGVDVLVEYGYHEEVFSMFRAWHNARRNEAGGPWSYLTLVLTYAAEASLLISNTNESPFNIGTSIPMDYFSPTEINEMNRCYDYPLTSEAEQERLFALCGGHPLLTRLALYDIKNGQNSLSALERAAELDGGIFRPYLDEIREILQPDTMYRSLVSLVAAEKPIAATPETHRCFQRLRSCGVLKGDSVQVAEFRCGLYRTHFTLYPL